MKQMLTIRHAVSQDSNAIADLSNQLGYSSTPTQTSERLHSIEKTPGHAVLVALNDHTVVGWVHVMTVQHLESGTFAEIAGLVVDERHRNNGIGKRLVETAEQWARDHGLGEMRVRTNVLRNRAHAFYEKNAYELQKQQKMFRKLLTG